MNRGAEKNNRRVLALALMMALAGSGCARFRKQPEKELPPPPVAETVETRPDAEKTSQWPELFPPKEHRLKVNPTMVLALQMQSLNAQRKEDEAAIHPKNRFTRWMDDFHKRWYCRLDNAARRVDTKWLAADTLYKYELSAFDLDILTRVGGRGNDGDFDFKLRFNADLALSGLEDKLHLYLDNFGRDALPGADPLKREEDTRLGVRTMWRALWNSELDTSLGLRWNSSGPVVSADLDLRWKWDLKGGQLRLSPNGSWYSDDGFGQTTTLSWRRNIGDRKIFEILTAERSTEVSDGVEFEQTLRFAWLRSGRGRGWVSQASVFPHLKSSEWIWNDVVLNISWRDALYRKWIYYTITPQVDFPREDDYQPKPSLRIGLQILMGGRADNLM